MDKLIQARIRRWRADPTAENAQAVAVAVSRTVGEPETRKVVVTATHGFGFSSELYEPGAGQFAAEYPHLIAALESGTGFDAAWDSLVTELRERFGVRSGARVDLVLQDRRADDFEVFTVTGLYRIMEYDGEEHIENLSEVLGYYW